MSASGKYNTISMLHKFKNEKNCSYPTGRIYVNICSTTFWENLLQLSPLCYLLISTTLLNSHQSNNRNIIQLKLNIAVIIFWGGEKSYYEGVRDENDINQGIKDI